MNIKEIEALLEKYYEGETSLAEEKKLKDFFLSNNIPLEWESHKIQFLYFHEDLKDEIDDRELEERVFAEEVQPSGFSLPSHSSRFYYLSGIAATFLLLIGLIFIFREEADKKPGREANFNDPELVFYQTRDILALVSVNFNKGIDKMQYLGQFDKAMQKMQMLSKFYQYELLIINPDPLRRNSIKLQER
jgi:hypothetical protein